MYLWDMNASLVVLVVAREDGVLHARSAAVSAGQELEVDQDLVVETELFGAER